MLPSQRNKHTRPRARNDYEMRKEVTGERTGLFDHATCFCKYEKKKKIFFRKNSRMPISEKGL